MTGSVLDSVTLDILIVLLFSAISFAIMFADISSRGKKGCFRRLLMSRITVYALLLSFSELYLLLYDAFRGGFLVLTTLVGLSLTPFSLKYSEQRKLYTLQFLIDSTIIGTFFLVLSESVLGFSTFWFLTDLLTFLLIIYELDAASLRAGFKYLAFSVIPSDISIVIMLTSVLIGRTPNLHINEVLLHVSESGPLLQLIFVLGCLSKSAAVPLLHVWLPEAHVVALAPASAVLSGFTVLKGLLLPVYMYLYGVPVTEGVAWATSSLSASLSLYSGLRAVSHSDLKKLLAWGTINVYSASAAALFLGQAAGIGDLAVAAILLAIAHGPYKASLFANSGLIELATGTRLLNDLGQGLQQLRRAFVSASVAVLSLAGMPPTVGFLAKGLKALTLKSLEWPEVEAVGIAVYISVTLLPLIYGLKFLTAYWTPRGRHLSRGLTVRIAESELYSLQKGVLIISLSNFVLALLLIPGYTVLLASFTSYDVLLLELALSALTITPIALTLRCGLRMCRRSPLLVEQFLDLAHNIEYVIGRLSIKFDNEFNNLALRSLSVAKSIGILYSNLENVIAIRFKTYILSGLTKLLLEHGSAFTAPILLMILMLALALVYFALHVLMLFV